MEDDADDPMSVRFLEVYLLWLFGWVLFCESAGDSVSLYMIPSSRCPRSVGVTLFWQVPTGGCVL
jgi:hypothetical protein